jgi:hypothetical protein
MNGEYQIDFEFGGGFLFDNVAGKSPARTLRY